ncbi:patatin-like phospholipase family protein [Kitasatospora viridis]|uniref:NTE family protein n=1 Tax=Kitasatospora viridis TaxID=281105 RepID=A0A561SEK5_9ACTN|nr:patatin-like phospholipase family protein [Kitasatospora viridis]TWF73277.1 NTE family protein [Kitasatospora viridis]
MGRPPETAERAVVLGPGGYVGTAWLAGLAQGLRGRGLDLGGADLIVGTSAGSMVGAMLATGQDFDRIATVPAEARPTGPGAANGAPGGTAGEVRQAVFAVLGDPALEPAERRRRVGAIAAAQADPEAERDLVAQRAGLIGAAQWPTEPRLLIPAVDAAAGEPVVWDRDSRVPLARAVAASSSFPGTAPPVTVDGRPHIDGALRAGSNTDLAAGARTVVVLEPLAHQFADPGLEERLTAAGARAVLIVGSEPPLDPAVRGPEVWAAAYQAGLAQSAAVAERLGGIWPAAAES